MKIIIVYHSGAGSTKTIAEVYSELLKDSFTCEIESVCLDYNYSKLNEYDFIIFGFPTYHCEASTTMSDFMKKMPQLNKEKNAFVFTTYGLYSGNTERIFIKSCRDKNINVCGSSAYKAPATDGALLFPDMDFMFNYGKNVPSKIKNDTDFIAETIKINNGQQNYMPRFKLYTILNYPNKLFGKRVNHNISLMERVCINCNKCIKECMRECWRYEDGRKIWVAANCEFCFKCIHHCPTQAIIISKNTPKKPKLNKQFYYKLKRELLQKIAKN